jgi:hypothetical protein
LIIAGQRWDQNQGGGAGGQESIEGDKNCNKKVSEKQNKNSTHVFSHP